MVPKKGLRVSELIISVSGLRGVVGKSLTPEVVLNYAGAYAATLPSGPIVVARDGRATGPMLASLLQAGLIGLGRDVIDAGIASTPTLGVLVREHQGAGGIQITASHNPPPYNGMKLFSAEGWVLPADEGKPILAAYQSAAAPAWVAHDSLGQLIECENTTDEHLRLVLATVDVEAIRAKRFRVLLDANQGAGSLLGRRLLEALNCEIALIGGDANGQFLHPPEPTAENLVNVGKQVQDRGVDIGFCQDPDADRLAIIDESGSYLGEEFTLALCVGHILASRKGAIVTNCSTSRMAQDLAEKQDAPFFRSKVGEANVGEMMRKHSAIFGGEGNGGPIDPRVGYVRDSFVGMAVVLDAMAASGRPISDLAADLPHYAIEKSKVPLKRDRVADGLTALEQHFADAKASRLDGLRLDWNDRWLLVRASNTEPILRIIAEAPEAEMAQSLCADAAQVIASV